MEEVRIECILILEGDSYLLNNRMLAFKYNPGDFMNSNAKPSFVKASGDSIGWPRHATPSFSKAETSSIGWPRHKIPS